MRPQACLTWICAVFISAAAGAAESQDAPDLSGFAQEWKLVPASSDALCAISVTILNSLAGRLDFNFVGNYSGETTRLVSVTLGKQKLDWLETEAKYSDGVLTAQSKEKRGGRTTKGMLTARIDQGRLLMTSRSGDEDLLSCTFEPVLSGVLQKEVRRCTANEGEVEFGACSFAPRPDSVSGIEQCVIPGLVLDEKKLKYYHLKRDERGAITISRGKGQGKITSGTNYQLEYREYWEWDWGNGDVKTAWSERSMRFPIGRNLGQGSMIMPLNPETEAQIRCFLE